MSRRLKFDGRGYLARSSLLAPPAPLLWDAIRSFNYGATAAMRILMVVVVSLLDLGSATIR
jgi:hypothetical protein